MADGFSLMIGGLQGVLAKIEQVAADAEGASKEIVRAGSAMMEKEAKANFSGAHKRGEPHEGGSKPNVVTGTLRRSIRADPIVRYGIAEYGTAVSPRTVYARRVELGYSGTHAVSEHKRKVRGADGKVRKVTVRAHTRIHAANEDGSNKGAYPYFGPAAEKVRPQLQALAKATWARFLHP